MHGMSVECRLKDYYKNNPKEYKKMKDTRSRLILAIKRMHHVDKGDIAVLIYDKCTSAKKGALAIVEGIEPPYVNIKWLDEINTGLRNGQYDGGYGPDAFRFIKRAQLSNIIMAKRIQKTIIPKRIQLAMKQAFAARYNSIVVVYPGDVSANQLCDGTKADLLVVVNESGKKFKIVKSRYGHVED
jgi:hypothetical protein